jgi:glycerol kinase
MTEIIAVDQGTTSTKAVLVDGDGEPRATTAVPVARSYPRPGWVEQDPMELWTSVQDAIAQLPASGARILALSSQRESVVVWSRRDGRPLSPCVSWQCNRGADQCRELAATGAGALVRELTGLPLDPMFSASKLRHLLDADPELRRAADSGYACAGTVDSWLLWRLSGGEVHVTDAGNAARTLLLDIRRREWSEDLLALFDIPRACLPRVIDSGGPIADTAPVAGVPRLSIGASLADSHAAAYGLGCTGAGAAKATYGTGTSLLAPTDATVPASEHGLAGTIAWSRDGTATYGLEGNVFSSGATVQWLAGILDLPDAAAVQRLAAGAADAGGVHLVPAFAGLGAPHWRSDARAVVSGISFATGRAQLARAAIESIAFQVADLVVALGKDLDQPLDELRVDGGASHNDALMQLQADLLACPVARLDSPNAAAQGAARFAAAAVGPAPPLVAADGPGWTRFDPAVAEPRREAALAGWHAAVARTLAEREQVVA